MRDFDRLLPEIVALADRAGAVILEHYQGEVAVRAKADEVAALKAQGLGATEIARQLGIGRASVTLCSP